MYVIMMFQHKMVTILFTRTKRPVRNSTVSYTASANTVAIPSHISLVLARLSPWLQSSKAENLYNWNPLQSHSDCCKFSWTDHSGSPVKRIYIATHSSHIVIVVNSPEQIMAAAGSWYVIYFLVAIFFCSFYLLNLVLAVVALSYEQEMKLVGREVRKATVRNSLAFKLKLPKRFPSLYEWAVLHQMGVFIARIDASWTPSIEEHLDWTLSTCGGSCFREKRITIYACNYQPKRGNVLAPSCGVQLFGGRPCFFCFVIVVVLFFVLFFFSIRTAYIILV